MARIEDEIKMEKFSSPFQKMMLNIMYTGNWLVAQTEAILKPHGISHQQYNVLRILKGQKGEAINLYEIQERMLSKMSNATRLVEKLRQKGLVTRKICEHNRRKVEITITEEGLELLKKLNPLIAERNKNFEMKISAGDARFASDLLDELRK